ncbi:MAG: MBL fold metallo-hydrolase [Wenzhouxiangellaceae bacterium]|nr:MBL fold metallo-hydrolase [Wenzhouxiangellaceae bacterium]
MKPSARWLASLLIACSLPLHAQDFSAVEIRTTPVADGVWTLQGAGGNLGLVVGEQGAFLIDDQYAPLTEKIQTAVAALTEQPIRFVFNTHWHGDHTGGNENLAEAGALVVAHDNVRKRMSAGQFMEFFGREVEPAADRALPVVTFNDRTSVHLGGHTVHAVHVPNAHTDGDAYVHLVEANVIHAGDIVFYGLYPFIDYGSGGHIAGMIDAVEALLAIADKDTRIITGHGGPVITRAQLVGYRDMLSTMHGRLKAMIDAGKSLAEVQTAGITAEFDAEWGNGFINPERWVELNYTGMQAAR